MKLRTVRRIADLKLRFTPAPGCDSCRAWPSLWIIGEDDPEPPLVCDQCGREFGGLLRVYIGVRLDDV